MSPAVTSKEHVRKANEALEKALKCAVHPDELTHIAREYRELAETVGELKAMGVYD